MRYKKCLTAMVIACSMSLLFAGCDQVEHVADGVPTSSSTKVAKAITTPSTIKGDRFITTKDTYSINGDKYTIIYDSKTDNVYLSAKRSYGNDTFPMLDYIGRPISYTDLKNNTGEEKQ